MSGLIATIMEVCCPHWLSFPTHFLKYHPMTIESRLSLWATHVKCLDMQGNSCSPDYRLETQTHCQTYTIVGILSCTTQVLTLATNLSSIPPNFFLALLELTPDRISFAEQTERLSHQTMRPIACAIFGTCLGWSFVVHCSHPWLLCKHAIGLLTTIPVTHYPSSLPLPHFLLKWHACTSSRFLEFKWAATITTMHSYRFVLGVAFHLGIWNA